MELVWLKKYLNEMNITLAFALNFECNANSFAINITASNSFRVLLNDNLVGYGPRRSGEGNNIINRYLLKKDENKKRQNLVVEVTSYQVNTYCLVDEPPFFAAEVIVDGKIYKSSDFLVTLVSDRIQKVARIGLQRAFTEVYKMGVSRENYYLQKNIWTKPDKVENSANLIDVDLPYPKFETKLCKEIESGSVFYHNNGHSFEFPSHCKVSQNVKGFYDNELQSNPMLELDKIGFSKKELDVNNVLTSENYKLYEFEDNCTGFIKLNLKATKESEILIVFDEILWLEEIQNPEISYTFLNGALPLIYYRAGTPNVVKYTISEGNYDLLTAEPYTFKYLKIICCKGMIEIQNVSLVEYRSDASEFVFSTNDEDINKIIEAAKNTFCQNALDIFMDCPSRERAGWLCDSYFTGQVENLLLGNNNIERNFLNNFLLAPKMGEIPASGFPMCYPSSHLTGGFIPNWCMWLIIELKDYYSRTKDKTLIDLYRNRIFDLISYFNTFLKNDLLLNLDGWVFIEWSECNNFTKDINFPTNMLYSYALKCAGELYENKYYIELSNKISDAVDKYSFNGDYYVDNAIFENGKIIPQENITETCQYYAIFCGIATRYQHFANKIFTNFSKNNKVYYNGKYIYSSNMFIGLYLRLECLLKYREYDTIIEEIKFMFLDMAKRTGTLWEHKKPEASCNHGFSSFAVVALVKAIIGDFTSKDALLRNDIDYTFTAITNKKEKIKIIKKNSEILDYFKEKL